MVGKQGVHPFHPYPVLEVPYRRAVGNIDRVFQATDARKAAPVQKLGFALLVG